MTLGETVRRIRMEHLGNLVVYAYQQALHSTPLSLVLTELKLTVQTALQQVLLYTYVHIPPAIKICKSRVI